MKLNIFNALIAIALSALIAFAISSFHFENNDYRTVVSWGCALAMICTLVPGIALQMPKTSRTTSSMRITAVIMTILLLLVHIVFAVFNFSITSYVISVGIILLIYVFLLKRIIDASKEV